MKKSQIQLVCLLLLTNITVVKADTILGLYAGYSYWQHDMADGLILESSDRNIKRSETGNVFYVALEHPVPFLPNIKLQHNNISAKGSSNYQVIGIFGLDTIYVNDKSDLEHTDFTFYYEILDNWVNLDLGLSAKYFTGFTHDFSYTSGQEGVYFAGRNDLDEWVPLLYAKGQFDLPFTGLSAYGSIQALGMDSNDVTDLELGVNYESKSGLGAVLGYRSLDVDFKKHGATTLNTKVDGFFVGINFHF